MPDSPYPLCEIKGVFPFYYRCNLSLPVVQYFFSCTLLKPGSDADETSLAKPPFDNNQILSMKKITATSRMITILCTSLNSKIFASICQQLKPDTLLFKKGVVGFIVGIFFSLNSIAQAPASALHFDGIDDHINIGDQSLLSFPTQSFTLQATVYPTGPGTPVGGGIIVNKEGEYEFARWADGTLRYGLSNGTSHWLWVNTNIIIPLNTWTQITMVYDRSLNKVLIYINGILEFENISFGDVYDSEPLYPEFRIGGRQLDPQNFEGAIDEVRIWSRPLSVEEIQASLTCELAGTQTNLVAYYKLNAGFVNQNNAGVLTATDASGNNLNGTLMDFALTGAASNWTVGSVTTACTSCTGSMTVSLGVDRYVLYGALGYTGCGSLTPAITEGTAPFTYTWTSSDGVFDGFTTASINPCNTTEVVRTYTVTVTDANGCTATSSVELTFINISCSNNGNNVKVKVCHRPPGNPSNCKTICVSVNAYQALLNNGSYLGECLPLCEMPNYARTGNISIADYIVRDELFAVKLMNNPTTTYFSIYIAGTKMDNIINIRITDIAGKLITQITNAPSNKEIKVGESFTPGIYLAEIKAGENRKIIKLIKQ
jgi:Concanavalin A-like lectin/glucanases superfamily/Secretion system C-terminal sorting domain